MDRDIVEAYWIIVYQDMLDGDFDPQPTAFGYGYRDTPSE